MLLQPTKVFSGSHFHTTHLREGQLMTAEASDLQPLSAGSLFTRLYDDAADEGFTIESQKTDIRATFAVSHVQKDDEGDVLFWMLKPVTEHVRKWPHLKDVSVQVFND